MKKRVTVYLDIDELEKFRELAGKQNLSLILDSALKISNLYMQDWDYKSLLERYDRRLSGDFDNFLEK